MTPRLKALLLLVWAVIRLLFRRLFGRPTGLALFHANYDAEGLPPVRPDERATLPSFSRCIACGLCDQGEGQRVVASGGTYRGLMQLILAASRSMPDYRLAASGFAWVSAEVLAQKEQICPTKVPFREIAAFVRDKAREAREPSLPVIS